RGAAPRGGAFAFPTLPRGGRWRVPHRGGAAYARGALASLDRLLRDHRTGEVHPIDPALFDVLSDVRDATGGGTFEVISGFRSDATNRMLREHSHGAAEKSLHPVRRAIAARRSAAQTPPPRPPA